MKAVLQKVIRQSTGIIKYLFPSPEERKQRKIVKEGDTLYKGIVIRLQGQVPPPVFRRKLLLHRRLRQYQRLRRHGSSHAKVAAIKKLEKEWRKYVRDSERKKGKVLPINKPAGSRQWQ